MRPGTGTTLRSRAALAALSAALVLTLRASLAIAAPDPAAWGESSGYNAIEASRATASSLVGASAPTFGEASGYDVLEAQRVAYLALMSAPESGEADVLYSIEASRAMSAEAALASGDIGSMQEEALTELVAAADAAAVLARHTGTSGIR
jgi:hypothetical protein